MPHVCNKLQFASSGIEILPGRLQHEEVRGSAVFVISPGESFSFTQDRQDLVSQCQQILLSLQQLCPSSANFERHLIPHGHELPTGLLDLSLRNGDAAAISVEDRQREPQTRTGQEAVTIDRLAVVDRIEIHELVLRQFQSFAGGLDGDLSRSQIGTRAQCRVHEFVVT